MSRKMTDDFIDDLPETITLEDESDIEAAFWDEFYFMEQKDLFEKSYFTVTVEDELTGEKKVFKHVQLAKLNKSKSKAS